ncbi:hypothetical protein [Pectinatus frisingensis]|uniref:hypothetical protein n=1 Tax=Pectinatus frisingensis TaxID=865 RepID=UPI0018C7E8C1|nr:hypothetical protein [Pectinatus frisingensis]
MIDISKVDVSKLPEDDSSHELTPVNIVLRDSLGVLAVSILSHRADFGSMQYDCMLSELHSIIAELHDAYHHGNF